ncbi:MAG: hypothetical protein L0312_01090 [Acidobacteria bacterium]|nr:hypothetical protein [Acidobacteriota bacterium]
MNYCITSETLQDLESHRVDLPFAIKYFKNVAHEFNLVIELRNGRAGHPSQQNLHHEPAGAEKPLLISSRNLPAVVLVLVLNEETSKRTTTPFSSLVMPHSGLDGPLEITCPLEITTPGRIGLC